MNRKVFDLFRQWIGMDALPIIVAAAVALTFLLLLTSPAPASDYGAAASSSDGYAYRDGLWWKDGKSYDRYADLCWKKEKYWVSTGCCGAGHWATRNVSYTCWKYRPVPLADPKLGIEKFAEQLLDIKTLEVKSEIKNRETYNFAKQAGDLAEKFGVTDYRIQNFGQNLNYGDPEYQYPAQQGSTIYGVKEYVGDFYGQAAMTLIDADRAINSAYELRKMSRQYDHDAELALGENVVAMETGRSANVSALAEMQELRKSLTDVLKQLVPVAEALKAQPRATIKEREIVPVEQPSVDDGAQHGVVNEKTVKLAVDAMTNHCGDCHLSDNKGKGELFPAGANFDEIASWNPKQMSAFLDVVRTGKTSAGKPMPPTGNGFNDTEQLAVVAWLSGQLK